MYFWNTSRLIDDLKQEKLTEENFKNYYICGGILFLFSIFILQISPKQNYQISMASFIINLGLLITWINVIFKANGGSRGHNFINRFVALYLPISIKLFVFFIFFYLCFITILTFFSERISEVLLVKINEASTQVIDTLYAFFVYWRIYKAIQKINS